MNLQLIHLAIGKPKAYDWNNKTEYSAIGKQGVARAHLKFGGFIDDDVANHKFHGGPDRAICLYPYEHYTLWNDTFDKELPLPAFGENITALGMREEQVFIGDIFRIGEALVQVTQGRVPCATVSNYNEEKQFLKKLVDTTLTGYFFRVLEEGTIETDSTIQCVARDPHEITVAFATNILFHQKQDFEAIRRILAVEALSQEWQDRFRKLIR